MRQNGQLSVEMYTKIRQNLTVYAGSYWSAIIKAGPKAGSYLASLKKVGRFVPGVGFVLTVGVGVLTPDQAFAETLARGVAGEIAIPGTPFSMEDEADMLKTGEEFRYQQINHLCGDDEDCFHDLNYPAP